MKRSMLSLAGGLLAVALTASAFAADVPRTESGVAPQQEATDDIVDTAIAAGDFETLVAAIQAAELEDTLRGEGPFTVFAPTDDAFDALPEGTVESLLEDIPALTDILLYHVIADEVTAEQVVELESAETVQGSSITIEVVDGDVIVNGSVMVTATDIMASNGVIHVIDTVLLPPDDDEEPVDDGFTIAPVPGGVVLTVYTGSLESLVQAGEDMDLHTAAATVGGEWVMHVFGAPAFVSADFDSQFADGFDGTPLAIRAY